MVASARKPRFRKHITRLRDATNLGVIPRVPSRIQPPSPPLLPT